ncbi:hypothetical protein CIHG_02675 [Coccidioides immitis H538.4]|uniref:Uncharacterized protein n=3 Tax=Coccidioides immitis TaxID=5501 RepID=A0A0J8R650_COCIT|nr:hypothetical protein CIRG_03000 [Coccidioides immitis RMSCC 2394]KMU80296.1 hypothetical protein CISG_08402 [Coccidioides immitis RMSCC 3703]KMU84892.1 hypothetical protein CIHG_02675 [Coccidioides immitis H538.4]
MGSYYEYATHEHIEHGMYFMYLRHSNPDECNWTLSYALFGGRTFNPTHMVNRKDIRRFCFRALSAV